MLRRAFRDRDAIEKARRALIWAVSETSNPGGQVGVKCSSSSLHLENLAISLVHLDV